MKASLPNDHDVVNIKTENTENIQHKVKTEDIKQEENTEVTNKRIKLENEDIKSENITESKEIKTENTDDQNVKIDVVSCSPTGYVKC